MKKIVSRAGKLTLALRSSSMLAFVAAALVGASMPSFAAEPGPVDKYPERMIRIVVPYSAGGGTDLLARLIAVGLGKKLGQNVIVDNRGGAATAIGSDQVSRAQPDGYTILMTTGTFAVLPALYPKLSFDPVRDFAPITLFANAPNVLLVHPSVPANDFKAFVAYAKSRSDPLNYGSSGNGGTGHLAMEMVKQSTGAQMVHLPYKSGGPAMNALLAGEVSAMINNLAPAVPQIKSGSVRALAVTSAKRSAALPDVPTIAESGLPGFEASAWFGALAPANTPPAIVEKLALAINEVVRTPAIQAALAEQGVDTVGNSPAEFAQIIGKDVELWHRVLKAMDIKPG